MPTQPDQEPCDHDWQLCDDSFDHEFGTEQIPPYYECQKCGERKPTNFADFDFEKEDEELPEREGEGNEGYLANLTSREQTALDEARDAQR